jgi:O-antigen ligase
VQRTLLFLLVAASYLLFAGGPTWTMGPLLGMAGLAAVAAPRRTFHFPASLRALDAALVAIVVVLLIQIVPLPTSVVSLLSPQAATVRASLAFTSAATPPSWSTLSIDRDATIRGVGYVVLGILSFWTARAVFGAGGNTRTFCRMLAVFAAAVGVLAIVQRAATPRHLMFVLAPEARSAYPFGAFVNRNDFGAWLMLVTAPVVGYLIARLRIHPAYRSGRWRDWIKHFFSSGVVMTATAAFIILGVLLATLSRSALAGLGAAALCGWSLGRHRLTVERTSWPAVLGAIGVTVLATVLFVDVAGWVGRLQQGWSDEPAGFGRLAMWRETLPMIRDFWLTGTGAGTFSDAMTQYQQSSMWVGSMQRWAHINNAHSAYLQVAAEGGVLVAIPVAAAVMLLARLARQAVYADKGEMFWVRVGATGGLAGLAVQSLWEIPLVMPANAVLCGVLAGLALVQREGRHSYEPVTDGGTTPREGLRA